MHGSFFKKSIFPNAVHCFFFLTTHALETWFELSSVKLCRNDLKENKNCLELKGKFEISRVPVTEGKITVNI